MLLIFDCCSLTIISLIIYLLTIIFFRPCVLCAVANEEDCKHTCGDIKLTKVNESATLVCFEDTVYYNVEMDKADGSIRILYVPKSSE